MKPFSTLRLSFVVSALALSSEIQAHAGHDDAAPASNVPNPKNLSYDSIDPTDIFAIPLDSSEREEDQELHDLEAQEEANLKRQNKNR